MSTPLHVLVVDDSDRDTALLVRLLRQGGYDVTFERVDSAEGLAAALDAAAWELIIADFSMPGFSAPAALRLVRERSLELPFIIVSGTISGDTAVQMMQDGAQDFLAKDDLTRLLPAVARELRAASERRARRAAEEALRNSEERFRTFVEAMPVGAILTGLQGRILMSNRAALEMLGLSEEQLAGKTDLDADWQVLAEDGTPLTREALPPFTVARTSIPVRDLILEIARPAVGDRVWVQGTALPFYAADGSLQGILSTFTDVTARRQAEESLRASEAQYRRIVETAQEGIWLLDAEYRTTFANQKMAEMLGYAAEEMQGVSLFTYLESDLHELAMSDFAYQREGAAVQVERRFRHRDGRTIWALIASAPLLDSAGNFTGVLGMVNDITVRKQAEEHRERHLQRLSALRTIDRAITASLDLRVTLDVFLDQVLTQLGIAAAQILLLRPQTQTLEYVAGHGFRGSSPARMSLRLGQGHAGEAALERHLISVRDLAQEPLVRTCLVTDEAFIAYFAVPLIAKGVVQGVLELFHRAPLNPDVEWLDFLDALAGQAAIAIDNASLFEHVQRSNVELSLAYDTTIEGWSRALDLRDKETEGHSRRVTEMTLVLARALGIGDKDLVHVRRGALLHDIGKMGIPDAILLKPGPLSEEEWAVMRQHPTYAYELLAPISYLRPALDIPYCHHEKWDGTGYPRGLRGEVIPLAARIFAVVDVWDALRSDRPYRVAWSEDMVRGHIAALAGSHFDPAVVERFLEMEIA